MPRPRSQMLWLSLAFVSLSLLALPLCVGVAFGARRVDLFHATLFNACAMHAHELHWQHPERIRQALRYDFALIADNFVFVEVWVANGPRLSFTQALPKNC